MTNRTHILFIKSDLFLRKLFQCPLSQNTIAFRPRTRVVGLTFLKIKYSVIYQSHESSESRVISAINRDLTCDESSGVSSFFILDFPSLTKVP